MKTPNASLGRSACLGMAPLILALLTTALFTTSTAVAQQPPSLYAQGRQAYAERQYAEAAKLFAASAAAKEQAGAADALLMEGRSLVNTGDLAGAERALKAFLQQDVRSAPALYLLGYVLQRENKPKESLEVFTRAAAIRRPTANDLRIVALDYVLIDDYPDAIHWLDRAVREDPQNADAWYDLGRSQMNQGDFVAAEKAFDRVLAIVPGEVKALNNLGLSYEAQNRIPDALRVYEAAIASQRNSTHPSEQPLLNYGTLLISQNRTAEAIPVLKSAIGIAPEDAKCREQLARAYQQTDRLPEAREQLERAVALDPKNPRLHYQLGRLYHRLGEGGRSREELDLSEKLYGTRSTPETK
jgi:tetratricopeptide (TPR) repeat protein